MSHALLTPPRAPGPLAEWGKEAEGKAKQGGEGTRATGAKAAGTRELPSAVSEDGVYDYNGTGDGCPREAPATAQASRKGTAAGGWTCSLGEAVCSTRLNFAAA